MTPPSVASRAACGEGEMDKHRKMMMPRKKKTITYNLTDENRGLKERLESMQETLEKVIKERSVFQGELLDTARKLRDTERELEATRHALVLMNENLIERGKGTWTAQIVYEPRIAKGD